MTNIKYYIIIFISIVTIGSVGYLFYQKLKPPKIYDTSQLTSYVLSNGQSIKTTGAIPTQDQKTQDSFNETLRLAGMGTVSNNQFTINVDQYGNIAIKIFSPFEKNKQAAIDWLGSNGFAQIDKSKITFSEVK